MNVYAKWVNVVHFCNSWWIWFIPAGGGGGSPPDPLPPSPGPPPPPPLRSSNALGGGLPQISWCQGMHGGPGSVNPRTPPPLKGPPCHLTETFGPPLPHCGDPQMARQDGIPCIPPPARLLSNGGCETHTCQPQRELPPLGHKVPPPPPPAFRGATLWAGGSPLDRWGCAIRGISSPPAAQ